ncbi:MAG: class I SAM-dependent methyltransferase [Magnetococcus sp. DMHC-6]
MNRKTTSNPFTALPETSQTRQNEWFEQWSMLEDHEKFLFEEWIQPYKLSIFNNKNILECGCGGGQHTAFMAEHAAQVTAVDLNTVELAKHRNQHRNNIHFLDADIATMDLGQQFDVVISIGVVHHTDNPDRTVTNLKRHLKPGGVLILWLYSAEGNTLVRYGVEPIRKLFLRHLSRTHLLHISKFITFLLYFPIYSLYLLPLRFLPYYEYFQNFRRLSFTRNLLNVFDKLNAPQTYFITRQKAESFVNDMEDAQVLPYKGVSWSVSGRLPIPNVVK